MSARRRSGRPRRRWVRGHRTHFRTIAGVRFKAHIFLRSAWVTDEGFQAEVYEGDGGGWILLGYHPRGPVAFTTLRSIALEIDRVRALIAMHAVAA